MVNLLLAAAALAASPQPAIEAEANPALFVVQDRDTTIYLFGTFHALDGKSDWFAPRVRSAFDESGELVLETLIPEPGARPAELRRPLGPALSVTPSASFLATTRLAIDAGKAHGMSVRNGADSVLRQIAEVDGKQVEGLETLDSQLRMFSRLPAPTGQGRPAGEATKASAQHLSDAMTAMQSAWTHGDQSVFVRMLDQLRQSSPATYRMMFTDRNARWADWIAARMDTPGSVFVAVGAGHLAGKDSVLVRLAEMGIESRRLN